MSKLTGLRLASTIEIDCRWPTTPLHNDNIADDDDDRYIVTGRGIRKTVKQKSAVHFHDSDSLGFVNSIGRGRQIHYIPPVPSFPI